MKQNCICVGAQKAGTSWLYKCLEEHSDICAATGKETNFFTSEVDEISSYEEYYSDCSEKKIFFEASTLYLYNEFTPNRILKYLPESKVIILLRDPVDRSLSHLRHLTNSGLLSSTTSIEKALAVQPTILEHSNYTKHVGRYTEKFNNKQLLILNYEDIVIRPQELIDSVCEFLEIETFVPKFLNTRYNTSTARSNPLYRKVTSVYLFLNKSKLGKNILNIMRTLGIRSSTTEILLSKTSKHNLPASESQKDKLTKLLSNEIDFYRTIFKNEN